MDFGKFEILNPKISKFEILNPKISKFEILNPNTKISNLDTKFLNFDDFCYKFEENLAEIDKIGDISKFEILNPKIQNLKSLTLKSKIFNFDKIWPKIKIPPRWFIITLRFHQNSKVKIFKNLSQYGRTILTNFFQNFEVDIKITKITKIGSNHQNFQQKILKTVKSTATEILTIFFVPRWTSGPSDTDQTARPIATNEIPEKW